VGLVVGPTDHVSPGDVDVVFKCQENRHRRFSFFERSVIAVDRLDPGRESARSSSPAQKARNQLFERILMPVRTIPHPGLDLGQGPISCRTIAAPSASAVILAWETRRGRGTIPQLVHG